MVYYYHKEGVNQMSWKIMVAINEIAKATEKENEE